MDFNKTKKTYRGSIEQSISFSGKGLDFFTKVKADCLRKIVSTEFPNSTQLSLLDIGCGHGYIHADLVKFGYKVTGVEVAHEVLPLAREANPKVKYLDYDGTTLPFDDGSFDITLTICVMHHVPPEQWLSFCQEMRRVLRPGGIAVIFEHNPFNPMTRYVVSRNRIDDDAVLLSPRTLCRILQDAEFESIKTRNILFTPFANPIFRALDEKLSWCPLGAQYSAIGKVN